MRVINVSLSELETKVLLIGFEGENQITQVRIDAAEILTDHPNATPTLIAKPLFGFAYPVIVTKEGTDVVWEIDNSVLSFHGDGEIQLTFTEGTVIAKSYVGRIRIKRSLAVNGEAPDPIETWEQAATAKLAEVDAQISELEDMVEAAEAAKDQAQDIVDDAASDIQAAGAAQVQVVQAAGEEVLDSIPSDYTTLSGDVTDLKSAIDQNGAMLLRFEKGGIASNGTDTDYRGDARARSFKYISDFDIKISCVEPVSTHCFKVYYYNADGTFDKGSDVLNTDYVIPSGSFFRILLMHDQSSSTAMALDAILAMFDYSFVNGSKAVKTELDDLTNNLTTYAPQNVAYNTGKNYDVTNDTPATVSNGAYCFYTIPTGTNIKRIRVTGHMPGSNKYPLVAFYDANSTLLDQFGVKSTTYTDEVISVPTGTVSILFNTNVNYVNIFEIEVPFDGSSPNIGELRAKYDGCFNYIAYSEIDNSGQSINTKEHFEWCAKKPVFKTLKADMQLTSDGKIVLCHDNGFTLNSSGKIVAFNSSNCTLIKNLTYAECIALQHNGTDQHVCGLDTVLKVAKKYGKHVYLTLRNEENDDYDDILDEMFAQLKKYSMESETIINCYPRNDTKADAVRARSDTICIGYTCGTTASQYPTYIAKVQALGNAILTPYIFFSEVSSISDTLSSIQTYINNAISQGIRVYVAILENDDAADDLMDCGVVGGQIRVLPTDIPMT